MGAYVSVGIPVEITVFKRNWCNNFEELKPDIKKCIERYIDIDYYNISETKDIVLYYLKDVNLVNEQMPVVINELKSMYNMRYFLCNYTNIKNATDEDIENELKKGNYNFELKYFDRNYKFENESDEKNFRNEYGIIKEDGIQELDYPYYTYNYWMINGNKRNLGEDIRIDAKYVLLESDFGKYGCESEVFILKSLNTFSKSYFKNKWTKNLQFYIDG